MNHRGIEGDCVEVMETLEERPDLIICDGPFGDRMKKGIMKDEVEGTYWFDQCRRLVKDTGTILVFVPLIALHSPYYAEMARRCKLTAVHIWSHNGWSRWNTEDEDYRKDHVHTYDENKKIVNAIMVFGQENEKSEYIGHYPIEELKYHPHQKPTDLYRTLVERYSNKNELILDPFMGSGILSNACLDRDYIGIDFDTKPYHQVVSDRPQ